MLRTLFLSVLAFCFSFDGLAQGGPPLKEVAHDSTLTGTGKEDSPLGIADGAVNSSKLATDNAPQAGQVLSFNGTGLTWQSASISTSGPLRVLDNNGDEVGVFDGSQGAIRYMPSLDVWVRFNVYGLGVRPHAGNFITVHESPDCTGEPYVLLNPLTINDLINSHPVRFGDTIYVASRPEQIKNVQSQKNWLNNACFLLPPVPPGGIPVLTIHSFPVSAVGTPPFRLSR